MWYIKPSIAILDIDTEWSNVLLDIIKIKHMLECSDTLITIKQINT